MRSRHILMLLLGLSVVLAGCSPPTRKPLDTPAVPISFGELFDNHFTPPPTFDNLNGLALYNTATELPVRTVRTEAGRFVVYAMINNRNPLQGILVGTHTPMTLSFFRERRNASTMISGSLQTFSDVEIVTWFAKKHGIHLATNDKGQPYWIDGTEVPTAIPAAARTAAPPPSAPQSPPAAHGRPTPEENEPFDRELVWRGQ